MKLKQMQLSIIKGTPSLNKGKYMEWFFDGIGTEIISIIIGIIIGAGTGGVVDYKIGINKSMLKQGQKAGDQSSQKQEGRIVAANPEDASVIKVNSLKIKQSQKAGNEASQTQIGGLR